jgi:hypothetical protein
MKIPRIMPILIIVGIIIIAMIAMNLLNRTYEPNTGYNPNSSASMKPTPTASRFTPCPNGYHVEHNKCNINYNSSFTPCPSGYHANYNNKTGNMCYANVDSHSYDCPIGYNYSFLIANQKMTGCLKKLSDADTKDGNVAHGYYLSTPQHICPSGWGDVLNGNDGHGNSTFDCRRKISDNEIPVGWVKDKTGTGISSADNKSCPSGYQYDVSIKMCNKLISPNDVPLGRNMISKVAIDAVMTAEPCPTGYSGKNGTCYIYAPVPTLPPPIPMATQPPPIPMATQ